MKLKTSTLIWIFFWCWFMGVAAISVGFGALFPSINLVARSVVCPHSQMDPGKQVYNPYPGKTVVTVTWYCVDERSGAQTELGTFPLSLYAGTFYGVLLFIAVVIGMALLGNRKQRMPQGDFTINADKLRSSEDTLSRMKELKDLRAANLISAAEYEEKRSEILRNL